jgi:hypothetical protein
MESRHRVGASQGYELLLQRLREIADTLEQLDAGERPLEHCRERRRLVSEQAYLLSAVAGLDGGTLGMN